MKVLTIILVTVAVGFGVSFGLLETLKQFGFPDLAAYAAAYFVSAVIIIGGCAYAGEAEAE